MEIRCNGCLRTPDQIDEFLEFVEEGDYDTAEEAVKNEEGTYNTGNGHFLCTDCYISAGMPANKIGFGNWVAP